MRLLAPLLPAAALVCGLTAQAKPTDRQTAPPPAVAPTVLSEHGSGRATAYGNANKIVTWDDRTHVTWLDSENGVFLVRIKTLNNASGKWSPTYTVGEAFDNHGGPALTVDSRGYLHIVYYPHHHPIRYRHSLRPNDASAWSEPVQVGKRCTYPTLVCGRDDTLYLMVRESNRGKPWRCNFYVKPPRGDWQGPTTVLRASVPGYCQFGQRLILGPGEILHLVCWFYENQKSLHTTVGYLRSDDLGHTWHVPGGKALELPADSRTVSRIAHAGPSGYVRGGAATVDAAGRVHVLHRSFADWPGHLVHSVLSDGRWEHRELDAEPALPGERTLVGGTLTATESGQLVAALTDLPVAVEDPVHSWGDARLEVAWSISRDGGATFHTTPLPRSRPEAPCWLPSIERPTGHNRVLRPAILYTDGVRGEGLKDQLHDRVVFVRP